MPYFNLLEHSGIPQLKKRRASRKTTPETKAISAKLGFDYYDGDRVYGFGGYYYDRRWRAVAEHAIERYNLNKDSRVLIERDEKGFLTFEFKQLISSMLVYGTHISSYPINHTMEGYGTWFKKNHKEVKPQDPLILEQEARQEILPYLFRVKNQFEMPFKDDYFDTVISINSICNHEEQDCRRHLREILRISKNNGKNSYIHTDSFETENQRQALMDWVLICKTLLSTEEWKKLYEEEGYKGDWGFVMFE